MKIDFHTHCFPNRIAKRAIQNLSERSGGIQPLTDGTAEGLSLLLKKSGVQKGVVMHIATNAHQMHAVNDFAAEINKENLLSFGSVYPHSKEALCELDRIKELGLKGVKFHPDYQSFYPDDENMKPLYQKISRLGLSVLFHAGEDCGFESPYHGMPDRLKKALLWLDCPVIFAHWGSMGCADTVLSSLCGLPVYFDTSFGYGVLSKDTAKRIIEKHGADRLLFGSDAPWHNPAGEAQFLEGLGLSQGELAQIYYKNARNILGICL